MLVVAVHDVAPSSLDQVRWLLARLDDMGVAPRVLKAIPAPGGAEIEPESEVAQLLRGEQAAGSEIVVHGYTHQTAGAFRGSPLDTSRARLYAPDDAEFLSIDESEAARRLARGQVVLEAAGLTVTGFCAPGWLAPPALDRLAADQGYAYVIGLLRIADLVRRRSRTVPPFGYMGADRTQERLVGIGGDTTLAAHRWLGAGVPHVRAFLHPAGASSSPDAARTLQRIGRLAAREPVGTYSQLLAGWDAAA